MIWKRKIKKKNYVFLYNFTNKILYVIKVFDYYYYIFDKH